MKRLYYPYSICQISILILFACISSCKTQKSTLPPPNIVWITSEDNSKHYLQLFDPNGAPTPNIEKLANHGLKFNRAFSNGPVCSVARSTLISGCYAPRTGTQFHRRFQKVPMPEGVDMFPAYLRKAGYYATNNRKEDYNYIKGDDVWDESSKNAHWKNRKEGQPFFHVFNIGITHESSLHFTEAQKDTTPTITSTGSFEVHPYHPQTELYQYTNAYYRDKIAQMDKKLGEVVEELEQAGLMENTFIFYFGDHGGVLPGSKGYLYEVGLHVPLVLRVPEKYKDWVDIEMGGEVDGFVSFIDFGPTVLNLAGVDVPAGMDGKPFLGQNIKATELNQRDESFGYADRFDEKYDQVRSLRKGKYKYIRNYQPFNFDGLMNNYRYRMLAYQEWQNLYEEGNLNEAQSRFFEVREAEMLFDLEADPYETVNLAGDPQHRETLFSMRNRLIEWIKEMPDLSFYPEHMLAEQALENPIEFGQNHKEDIEKYIDLTYYVFGNWEIVNNKIEDAMNSSDAVERYWGLVNSSTFGPEAMELENTILNISQNDPEPLNRVRAAEFLAMNNKTNPTNTMTEALYQASHPMEGLMILNSIVLMNSSPYKYEFDISLAKMQEEVREDSQVKRRLEYLDIK